MARAEPRRQHDRENRGVEGAAEGAVEAAGRRGTQLAGRRPGGRVYLHTRVKDKTEEQLTAFDADSGKPLWEKSYERSKFTSPFGNGPRGTPAVVDNMVYTYGITGMLSCFDAVEGRLIWQEDVLKKYKAANLFFGTSTSPIVEGDLVVVDVGGKGASIVAFDRRTGVEKWKALDDRASYSSPIALGKGKDRQLVFLTGKRLVGLAPLDGKLFWEFPLVDLLSESSTTPAVAGDVLFGSSVTVGGVALKLENDASGPHVKKLWTEAKYNCYFSTPVAVGEYLYLVTGNLFAKTATLRCVETASGKEMWMRDKVGTYHASLTRTRRRQAADAGGGRRPGIARPRPDGIPRAGTQQDLRQHLGASGDRRRPAVCAR